jgi:hypothetical protein
MASVRAVILGHQDEIVRQMAEALDEAGVTHGTQIEAGLSGGTLSPGGSR